MPNSTSYNTETGINTETGSLPSVFVCDGGFFSNGRSAIYYNDTIKKYSIILLCDNIMCEYCHFNELQCIKLDELFH